MTKQPAGPLSRRPLVLMAVLGILAVHAALLLSAMQQTFVTVDEVGHIAAGISHWETRSYGLYRVNPPLARMLAVLPILAASPDTAGITPTSRPGMRGEWASGRRFAEDNPDTYHRFVCRARLAGVPWSLLGGLLIFFWARELYGDLAGCLGLAMWSLGPNLLAYAQLVIPDVPATVAILGASYAFWHYLRSPSWPLAWLAGILLGIAQLTKFTSLLLYGLWPLLWLSFHLSRREEAERAGKPLAAAAGQGLLIVLLSVFIINLGYEFRGSFRPLGGFPFISETFSGKHLEGTDSGNRFRGTWLASFPVPVPDEYLRGIDVQRQEFEQVGKKAGSYLAGEWREVGWWYYFLYALAVKVPLGIWALVLWALVLTLCGHPSSARWRDELTLWLPALTVLIVVSSQTGFNHHMRYVLPLFPFVIISTSKLATFLHPARWAAGLMVMVFLGWAAVSGLSVRPHFMSYFNELAGGPAHGHDHLVDSREYDRNITPTISAWAE